MRKKPPCRWAFGHDCPYRHLWCHHTCEQFVDWKSEIESENRKRAEIKEIEWLMYSQSAKSDG